MRYRPSLFERIKDMARKNSLAPYSIKSEAGFVFLSRDGQPVDMPLEDTSYNREYLRGERARLNTAYAFSQIGI